MVSLKEDVNLVCKFSLCLTAKDIHVSGEKNVVAASSPCLGIR